MRTIKKAPKKTRPTLTRHPDESKLLSVTTARIAIAKQISEQMNRMLVAKFGQGHLVRHNLEKGLGNEQALRELLKQFLPLRYGVGKGKVTNGDGDMSKHLDVIIYDALSCPPLFVDENRNQILPIAGCGKTTSRLKILSRFRDFSD